MSGAPVRSRRLTASHWGTYEIGRGSDSAPRLGALREDPDPSPIGLAMLDAYGARVRIARPAVRAGWLERGPGASYEGAGPRALRRGALAARARPLRRRDPARARAPRERRYLRRIVRLSERGPLPPRAEPAAPLLQPGRWACRSPRELQLRGRAGASARDRRADGDARGQGHRLGHARRAHAAARVLRRRASQERAGQPLWRGRAPRSGRPGQARRGGRPDRQLQSDALGPGDRRTPG